MWQKVWVQQRSMGVGHDGSVAYSSGIEANIYYGRAQIVQHN